jgi:hypothetical protein
VGKKWRHFRQQLGPEYPSLAGGNITKQPKGKSKWPVRAARWRAHAQYAIQNKIQRATIHSYLFSRRNISFMLATPEKGDTSCVFP